jgi:tRNA pseudouridine38-40 synthase
VERAESSGLRRIALRIAYDGSAYAGWQIQARERSVQGSLEEALERMHGRRIPLTGAGRTDSGVHARGQVAHFDTDIPGIPGEKVAPALNRLLPPDIRILASREVPADFHARYRAVRREYRYYLLPRRIADPFQRPYCWARGDLPDPALLNRYAGPLTGRRDFTSFAAERDPSTSKVRLLESAAFYPEGPYTLFRVVGNAFLWRMVRTIVGTIVEQAVSGADPREMERIIAARNRAAAGATAPARGLFLHGVYYHGFAV